MREHNEKVIFKVAGDNDVYGYGRVVGVGFDEQPLVGRTYIIKDESGIYPNENYPYDTIMCFECQLTDYHEMED